MGDENKRAAGLHLWSFKIYYDMAGGFRTFTHILISTKHRSIAIAQKKLDTLLRHNAESYPKPALKSIKYKGTIDA